MRIKFIVIVIYPFDQPLIHVLTINKYFVISDKATLILENFAKAREKLRMAELKTETEEDSAHSKKRKRK